MKALVTIIVFLFLVAVGISLYLVLSPEDFALMFLKGEKFTKAENYYKARYHRGDRSVSTLVPLQSIALTKGDNDAAILLIEEYLLENSDDVQARKLLGLLYLFDQRRPEYLRNLEYIYALSPDKEVLEELSDWYNALGDQEKEKLILEDMINQKIATQDDYLTFSRLLAADKEYQKAFTTLQESRKVIEEPKEFETFLFETALLLELRKTSKEPLIIDETLLFLFTDYFTHHSKNSHEAVSLIYTLLTHKREDLAHSFSPHLERLAYQNEELQTLLLEIAWEMDEKRYVYEKLLFLAQTMSFEGRLLELYVLVLIERKKTLILKDLFDHVEPKELREIVLLDIANLSTDQKSPELAKEVASRLGESYLQEHPILHAAYALALGKEDALQLLTPLLEKNLIPPKKSYILMQIAENTNQKELALTLGDTLFPFTTLSREELLYWAIIYASLDQEERAYRLLKEAKLKKSKEELALAILNAKSGKIEEVSALLERRSHFDKGFLSNLYIIANNEEEYSLAFAIASKLASLYPSHKNRVYLAQSYLKTGQLQKAYILFTKLREEKESEELLIGFAHTLFALGKTDEKARKELDDFIDESLANKHLPESLLQDLGYLLFEELGQYERALKIFQKLTNKKKVDKNDLATLTYLLGPRPEQEHANWIKERAKKAIPKNRPLWIKALLQTGQHELANALLEELPESDDLTLLRIKALIKAQKLQEAKELFSTLVDKIDEIIIIEQLLDIALRYNFQQEVQKLLQKLVKIEPEEGSYWQKLAMTSYELGAFSYALCAFNKAFALGIEENIAESYYFYGQILDFENCPNKAKVYYWNALFALDRQEEENFSDKELRAFLLFQLDYKNVALSLIKDLYEETHIPSIQAAYANLMMQAGYLGKAKKITEFTDKEAGSITITFKEPVTITAEEEDNELLITFSLPVDKSDSEKALTTIPSGIQEIEGGFRSLVLIGKENTSYEWAVQEKSITIAVHSDMISEALLKAKANIAMENRRVGEGVVYLQTLLKEEKAPDEDTYSLVAALTEESNRWQMALAWLKQAYLLNPQNEETLLAYRNTLFPHKSYAAFIREIQRTRAITLEQYYRVEGAILYEQYPSYVRYLGLKGDVCRAHISEVTQTDGSISGFLGNRTRMEFFYEEERRIARGYKASLYVAEGIFGVGARGDIHYDNASFFLEASWHKPYWEIIEMLVNQGFENKIKLGMSFDISAHLLARIEPGLQLYGIRTAKTALTTRSCQGEILLNLKLANPILYIDYLLDAEYVKHKQKQIGDDGEPFFPVPLDSRENHTVRIGLKTIWRKMFEADLFVGETYNRLATHNYTMGLTLHYTNYCGLELEFSAMRFPSTTLAGQIEDDFRGVIKCRF